ncbi:MAG: LCP family protein [Clostridium sp.]|nr:LCP family protein [Clostridium sp.]
MSKEDKAAEYKSPHNKKVKKKKTPVQIILIVLIVLVSLAIITVLAAYFVFHHYYSKMNIDKGGNINYATTEFVEDDINPEATDSDADIIADVEEELRRNLEDKSTPIMFSEHVYNILLIGNDARDKNTLGRSDSMIILSINEETKKIIMTSIMRDSYVYIPDYGYNRINAAYAWGGAELLIDTIEANFKIKIDSYAAVNFFSFMDVIDVAGGVRIDVSDAEVKVMNNYISELNRLEGISEEVDKLEAGGTYTLNGKQALAYSRIRYVGNADYERTERQRRVLEKVFNSMKACKLSELNQALNTVLPEITTNIEEGEMLSLLLDYTVSYRNYEILQCRVPRDGTIENLTINGAMVLGIDLQSNIDYMRESIYGE